MSDAQFIFFGCLILGGCLLGGAVIIAWALLMLRRAEGTTLQQINDMREENRQSRAATNAAITSLSTKVDTLVSRVGYLDGRTQSLIEHE